MFEARSENGCGEKHFWCEIRAGFGVPCGTPPLRFPRSTPPPHPPPEQTSRKTSHVFVASFTVPLQMHRIRISLFHFFNAISQFPPFARSFATQTLRHLGWVAAII